MLLGKLPGHSLLHKSSNAAAAALACRLNASVKLRIETECESMPALHGVTAWLQNLHAQEYITRNSKATSSYRYVVELSPIS
jgi:hypothetical protein